MARKSVETNEIDESVIRGVPFVETIDLILRGRPGSPLVVHRFSEKAKAEIRAKQQKKNKELQAPRDPKADFEAAKYIDSKGRECAPITAIKKAIVTAATVFDKKVLTKVALRQAIFVDSIASPGSEGVPIETHDGAPAKGVMREDAVTLSTKIRGLTYRPEYKEWQLRIRIEYNERLVSVEQLIALVDQAGWGVGICEGRPEKTSALGWGRFYRV